MEGSDFSLANRMKSHGDVIVTLNDEDGKKRTRENVSCMYLYHVKVKRLDEMKEVKNYKNNK